jgi:hypothetical protein
MLVLALEFSRGCTAHAEVGTTLHENNCAAGNHPTGARTGCVVTAGARRRGHGAGRTPGLEELPKGSTQTDIDPPRGSHERRRDVTGTDPKGRSLKTE